MITPEEGVKIATARYEHDNVTLDVLSALQSSNLIVSKTPFRIDMKNVTPQDVTIMNNLYVPIVDKKIKHIIVELLQNIIKNQSKEHAKKSHFILEQKDGTLHIEASNYMEKILNGKDKEDDIKTKIGQVNFMGSEELKALYKQKLNDSTFTDTGGGGLGFVDIARKIRSINPDVRDTENPEKLAPIYKNYTFNDTEYENIKEFILEINIPIKEHEGKTLT